MNKVLLRSLILAARFAVTITVLSQLIIPLEIVSLARQTFAIGLTATVLGKGTGIYTILIYFLLGLIGLPVYAGTSSRFSIFFGSTGGYLTGFIFNDLLTGYTLEKTIFNYTWAIIMNITGALVTLVLGTVWLKYSANLLWPDALTGRFAPFTVPGIIKAVAAAYVGTLIRQRSTKRFLAHLS